MADKKKVKVKILKAMPHYDIGKEYEVDEELAQSMCRIREVHNGTGVDQVRNAITVEEFEKMLAAPIDKNGMTQKELTDLGLRNVVQTPDDGYFSKMKTLFSGKKSKKESKQAVEA